MEEVDEIRDDSAALSEFAGTSRPPIGAPGTLPGEKRWTVGASFGFLASVLGLQVIMVWIYLGLASQVPDHLTWEKLWRTPLTTGLTTATLLVALIMTKKDRRGAKPLWATGELRDWRGWRLMLFVVATNYALPLIRFWFTHHSSPAASSTAIVQSLRASQLFPWASAGLLFVSLTVLAPVGEEWFFRGILQPALQARWNLWVALPGAAFCFGLMHGGPWFMITLHGLTLGWLGSRRPTLTFNVVAHSLYNLLVFGGLVAVGRLG